MKPGTLAYRKELMFIDDFQKRRKRIERGYDFGDHINSFYSLSTKPSFLENKQYATWKDDKFTLVVNVPGFSKQDLTVTFRDTVLHIVAKKSNDDKVISKSYNEIIEDVDPESIKAVCENGQVTVTGSRLKAKTTHNISVE